MKGSTVVMMLCLGVAAALLAPRLKADAWNKKTEFTFNQPVEVPGMVLPAGTYTFKLLDSQSDRNIVQIFNKNQTKLYATILAVPDERLQPTGKTVLTFEERAAGAPQAVRAWFYPGDLYGQEFVYPKARAVELAKANRRPVPAMPSEMEANIRKPVHSAKEAPVQAMKKAPLKAEQPSGEEVEIATVFPQPAPAARTHARPHPVQTAQAHRLPKTASPLPLVALLGLLSVSGGFALRFASRRVGE